MKTQFLRVTTKDKLILQGLLYEPDQSSKKAILHVHGMAGNFYENRFLDSMAKVFTQNGWTFWAINTRGHDIIADFPIAGEKEEFKRLGNSRERFEDSLLDIEAWTDFIASHNYKNIVLQGHSLGAVKVAYYLAKTRDQRVSKLVLISPPDMVGLAEAEKDHQDVLNLSKKMVKEGKGEELLPRLLWNWYYLCAATYIDFGERGNPIDVFNTYDKDKSSIIENVKIPTLALFGSKDDAAILPVREALDVIKSKAKSCPQFDADVIEGAPHSYFEHEDEVAGRVISWLNTSK
ncbi:MAG: alpha/beta fold hydrolase [Candidatus Woesebacteria bacterium]|nr:MAG: alpha/beta fold hydrolase [Candidatus Woesebacteria bacterium]